MYCRYTSEKKAADVPMEGVGAVTPDQDAPSSDLELGLRIKAWQGQWRMSMLEHGELAAPFLPQVGREMNEQFGNLY